MRIGVYQMKTSDSISVNDANITGAVEAAARQKVRLLVFPECALCGYPPVETPSVDGIDMDAVDACLSGLTKLAKQYDMVIAVGTVRKEGRCYNSVVVIGPDGILGAYDKRALWGWDSENFEAGTSDGIFDIDGVKTAFRICYEVRFPEFFREAFRAHAELCFVCFCDVCHEKLPARYELLKAHLATRACENIMTVISVNSVSQYQTAPTAVFSEEGIVQCEAPQDIEHLLVYDYEKPAEQGFGTKGRRIWAEKLGGLARPAGET